MAHKPSTALLARLVLRAARMVVIDNKTRLRAAYGAQAVLLIDQRLPLSTRQFVMTSQILAT